MKKLLLLVALAVLLVMTSTVALAGDKDDQPKVGYFEGSCGINAGPFGWVTSSDYWIADYANGVTILKCMGEVDDPPDALYTIKPAGGCVIPGDFTYNSTVKIFPSGDVHLICKFTD